MRWTLVKYEQNVPGSDNRNLVFAFATFSPLTRYFILRIDFYSTLAFLPSVYSTTLLIAFILLPPPYFDSFLYFKVVFQIITSPFVSAISSHDIALRFSSHLPFQMNRRVLSNWHSKGSFLPAHKFAALHIDKYSTRTMYLCWLVCVCLCEEDEKMKILFVSIVRGEQGVSGEHWR